jgi:hypothetical protein
MGLTEDKTCFFSHRLCNLLKCDCTFLSYKILHHRLASLLITYLNQAQASSQWSQVDMKDMLLQREAKATSMA